MKKEIFHRIKIPEKVQIELNKTKVSVRGPEGEISREFKLEKTEIRKDCNELIIGYKRATKKEKREINSIVSHVKNMILGVQKKFVYQLKICYRHFPMNVELKDKELIIKNFLGEKVPRKTKIPPNVNVEINKDLIVISSPDKELAGQTSANIEIATKIRNRDRRVFQDGIFVISKPGEKENG